MNIEFWPSWAIITLFIAAAAATTIAAPRLRARLFGPPGDQAHLGAFEAIKLLGALTAVFLAFLLVQSMSYLHAAELAVAREAGNVLQLDRALAAAPEPTRAQARTLLALYVTALLEKEWPAMQSGRDSPGVDAIAAHLQDAVSLLPPGPGTNATAQIQRDLNDVEDDRTNRLGASRTALPTPLWWGTALLFGLFMLSASFMRPNDGITTALPAYACGLALLAGLLFVIDGPYRGAHTVCPNPLRSAALAMKSRTAVPTPPAPPDNPNHPP